MEECTQFVKCEAFDLIFGGGIDVKTRLKPMSAVI
jgi:hypothetical protein